MIFNGVTFAKIISIILIAGTPMDKELTLGDVIMENMSIALDLRCFAVFRMRPTATLLLVWISVAGWACPILVRVVWMEQASLTL